MRSRGIVGVGLVWCHVAALLTFLAMTSTWGLARGFVNTHTRQTAVGNARAPPGGSTAGPLNGVVLELRGGNTVGTKKASGSRTRESRSKTSSGAKTKGKGVKKMSAKGKKDRKPSLLATLKAFFVSLVNPHFALKLEAKKKNQVHTVHGSASTTTSS